LIHQRRSSIGTKLSGRQVIRSIWQDNTSLPSTGPTDITSFEHVVRRRDGAIKTAINDFCSRFSTILYGECNYVWIPRNDIIHAVYSGWGNRGTFAFDKSDELEETNETKNSREYSDNARPIRNPLFEIRRLAMLSLGLGWSLIGLGAWRYVLSALIWAAALTCLSAAGAGGLS
jgi:hypothetical protein